MAGQTMTIKLKLSGYKETRAALRELPPAADVALRAANRDIAVDLAGWLQNAARNDSAQSALIVPTIKAGNDRFVPTVTLGGAKRVGTGTGKSKGKAFQILFGANFGATTHPQFRPHTGSGTDYFVWRTVEENQQEIDQRWGAAMDGVVREFGDAGRLMPEGDA